MQIRSTLNGGVAEVTDEYGTELIALPTGEWESADAKPRRKRRTKAQIEADKAAEAAKNEE